MKMHVQSQQKSILETLCTNLQDCIANGDVSTAQFITKQLCDSRTMLRVLPRLPESVDADEKEIQLRVHIEDRDTTGACIPLKARTSDTILQLKQKVMMKYEFPHQIQRWIIGKRLVKDNETLAECGVTLSNSSLYLYLLSCQSVGLDRKHFDREFDQMHQSHKEEVHPVQDHRKPKHRTPRNNRDHYAHMDSYLSEEEETAVSKVTDFKSTPPIPDGWNCPACTYLNVATRPGCQVCNEERPADYKIPDICNLPDYEVERLVREKHLDDQAKQAEQQRVDEERTEGILNYHRIISADDLDLVPNKEEFNCPVCFLDYAPGNGVVLRNCLHHFCRDCLAGSIQHTEEAGVKCPFQDDIYSCNQILQDREVRALVPDEQFEKYLNRSLAIAENQAPNSFHCKTTDCNGWCLYEDEVNFFQCPVCEKVNCLTCKVIHEGMNCKEYQDALKRNAEINLEARQTQQMLEAMLCNKEAMKCPGCQVIIQKKEGCDWLQCSICRTEICWVTRGPRRGPNGCRCGENGRRCHPECQFCH